MLCPRCGSDVGSSAKLCDRCLAADRSDKMLGAEPKGEDSIRGERYRARNYSPESDLGEDRSMPRESATRVVFTTIAALFVLTLLFLAFVHDGSSGFGIMDKKRPPRLADPATRKYAHVPIAKPQIDPALVRSADALFTVGSEHYAFLCSDPTWMKTDFVLTVECLSSEHFVSDLSASSTAQADSRDSLFLRMSFARNTSRSSRRLLNAYLLELHRTNKPRLEIERRLGNHLTETGEVSGFSGLFEEGEVVRGRLQGNTVKKILGKNESVSWQVYFHGHLRVPEL